MARASTKQSSQSMSNPDMPMSSPAQSHNYDYTLQAVMDMRQSMGEFKASIDSMNLTMQGTKAKVDDLVNWKNRILGGAIVLGTICALLGFVVSKFSNYITISAPSAQQIQKSAKQ